MMVSIFNVCGERCVESFRCCEAERSGDCSSSGEDGRRCVERGSEEGKDSCTIE